MVLKLIRAACTVALISVLAGCGGGTSAGTSTGATNAAAGATTA